MGNAQGTRFRKRRALPVKLSNVYPCLHNSFYDRQSRRIAQRRSTTLEKSKTFLKLVIERQAGTTEVLG